ncbi:MAG: oxidoreductase [Devosia sp. 67-54]|uniref:Gfo/Idh/MocA family protein n=1 Tax=unclassified Devosia TaxID=196773 RepID=UPI00095F2EB6|nr:MULTISPECIES: Gfo/Idh/MocA family oxidoreductase [unclassified Devosia]MBN9305531.1 Gfo/Idh/MocA family oxidoreductase [Devosia sp.]OJX19113.1 MAG: oxidoreductase [Devosia sp. 67-54]
MSTLRWGILATGNIAEKFVTDLQLTGHAVVAVGSRSPDKAAAFASRFGLARAHGSYEALVADPEVDAVYVATPHPMHAPAARLAIAAGKHVLVEKPFALNAMEATDLVERAASRGVVLLEAMWMRFLPHMAKVRELLAAGAIGTPRTLVATHTRHLSSDPRHRLNDPALGGGALLDLGVYPVSFAVDMLGAPTAITASARFKPTGVDAEVAATFRHAGGAVSMILCASDTEGPNTAQITGTDGYIELDPIWLMPTTLRLFDSKRTLRDTYTPDFTGRGLHYQAAELERLVDAARFESPILPPAQTVAVMQALDTIRAQIGLHYPSE